jgi:hypothetical protein
MLKPLKEEQAAMKSRWSDPAYQWANDSALRRKILKETDNARNKERKANRQAEQNKDAQKAAKKMGNSCH